MLIWHFCQENLSKDLVIDEALYLMVSGKLPQCCYTAQSSASEYTAVL